MKKWQLGLVLVGLLGMVYAMNVVQQLRAEKQAALEKAAKEAREKAERDKSKAGNPKMIPAMSAHGPGVKGAQNFPIPKPVGPQNAPVKINVFLDGSNSCHETSTDLVELSKAYGKLVRVDFMNMTEAEVAKHADKLQLGCAAGLAINGKVEMMVKTPAGKRMIAFRGPANKDQFQTPDIYLAVNTILEQKGIKVPEEAKKRTLGSGAFTNGSHAGHGH